MILLTTKDKHKKLYHYHLLKVLETEKENVVSCNLPSFFMRRSASNSFMISFCTLCTWSWTNCYFDDLPQNRPQLQQNQELLNFMITCCLIGTWGDTHRRIYDIERCVLMFSWSLFTMCGPKVISKNNFIIFCLQFLFAETIFTAYCGFMWLPEIFWFLIRATNITKRWTYPLQLFL